MKHSDHFYKDQPFQVEKFAYADLDATFVESAVPRGITAELQHEAAVPRESLETAVKGESLTIGREVDEG